jgi:L-threonylcarbamoyladenylate synthase
MDNSEFLSSCSAGAIQRAAERIKAGYLVAFPTETVYGLGADAINEEAVKRIYKVKGRPTNHPLIVHLSSINGLDLWARDIPNYALELARAFWPGPMTMILKRKEIAKDFITGSQDSVGIRVPSNPIALELLTRFESLGGLGIAAPSANRFGKVSPTSSNDVHEEIGEYLSDEDMILDGGRSNVGIESTIIDCSNSQPSILRPGAITASMISQIKELTHNSDTSTIRVSGSLESHYAPKAKLFFDVLPTPGQGLICLSDIPTPVGVIRLAAPATIEAFAQVLYESLRKADSLRVLEIVIYRPIGEGLAAAIRDRLEKAATER